MVPQKSFLALFAAARLAVSYTVDPQKIWPNAIVRLNVQYSGSFFRNYIFEDSSRAMDIIESTTCVRFFPPDVTGSSHTPLRGDATNDLVGIPREPINIYYKDSHDHCGYDGKSDFHLRSCNVDLLLLALAATTGITEAVDKMTKFDLSMLDAINTAYKCNSTHYPKGIKELPKPPVASPNSNKEKSIYKFVLDETTIQYMKRKGIPKYLGVSQTCVGKGFFGPYITTNTGFVEYKESQTSYSVEVNRCKKNHSRYAARYQGLFCGNNKEKDCTVSCVGRELDNQKRAKGVLVNDPLPWVCHENVLPSRTTV